MPASIRRTLLAAPGLAPVAFDGISAALERLAGECRLNVAITRARQELRIFASLKAEQFDLSRTQAAGVRDLKHFLEFAERGPRALAEATKGSLGGFESPFEEAVAAALASKGWQVQTQIGASSFRVDLGVVHPDAPGTYLCGVECDGATYHRSATARDRDMLREQVLRGLGPEIVRIWSTDWWVDRAGTLEKVHAALERLLDASRQQRRRERERDAAAVEAREAIAKASSDEGAVAEAKIEGDMGAAGGAAAPGEYEDNHKLSATNPLEDVRVASASGLNADAFFAVTYDARLRDLVREIVAVEGPVRDTVQARRIARLHGWQRTGARIQERVSSIAYACLEHTKEDVGVFFWAEGRGPGTPVAFRGDTEVGINLNEICIAELVSVARLVLAEEATGEGAVAAMAKRLGINQVRAASRGRLESALTAAGRENEKARAQ